jgi:hypothetical protein
MSQQPQIPAIMLPLVPVPTDHTPLVRRTGESYRATLWVWWPTVLSCRLCLTDSLMATHSTMTFSKLVGQLSLSAKHRIRTRYPRDSLSSWRRYCWYKEADSIPDWYGYHLSLPGRHSIRQYAMGCGWIFTVGLHSP